MSTIYEFTAQSLAGNVLATEYLFDAMRRAGVRCRVLIPGSATVYAPSSEPISETAAIAPASPWNSGWSRIGSTWMPT